MKKLIASLFLIFAYISSAQAGYEEETCINSSNPEACRIAGIKYLKGYGVRQSESKGLKYLGMACNSGDVVACVRLGNYLAPRIADIAPGRRSRDEAIDAYGKGCDLGWQPACDAYAKLNSGALFYGNVRTPSESAH